MPEISFQVETFNAPRKFEEERLSSLVMSLSQRHSIFPLVKTLLKNKVRLIHTHGQAALVCGTLAARILGIKCLHSFELEDPPERGWIWAASDAIIVNSKYAKEQFLKENKVKKEKVKVIYDGVDLTRVVEENSFKVREDLGLSKESFVIGHVGSLVRENDQVTLIKAFRKLIQKKVNAVLVIAGDGPLRKDLEGLVKELGLGEWVRFVDFRKNILAAIDVLATFSFQEGLPTSILEAMAASKPVVATKIGGHRELVVDGETGYLVPCGFPERMEAALMRFYANRSLVGMFGEAGRKRIEEGFSKEVSINHVLSLYKEILAG